MNLPEHLKKGDSIGIISPSAPLAGLIEHRYKNGVKKLKELGFNVILGKHSLKITNYTAGSPKERAEDIMDFFIDGNIKAIISFIGGYHSNEILKYLDFDVIKRNPKILMGYSDMTVLLLSIYTKCNFPTFYGPSVLNQFADIYMPKYTKSYFEKAVMATQPIGEIYPSETWTDEFLDWFEKKDLERERKFVLNSGWEWLKKGKASRKNYWWMFRNVITFKRH